MDLPTRTRPGVGPFEPVRELSYDAPFPRMLRVRQRFDEVVEDDVAAATVRELAAVRGRVHPGMRIAITAGSRGIHDKPAVLRAAGEWLRAAGAEPFLVPAMGSHAGANADGQVAQLGKLGITEESVGLAIRATMDTVTLGRVDGGPVAHLDRYAAEADGILVVNRIKAHTDFRGPVESGLAKMTAIGLGKQRGAEAVHAFGPANLARWIPALARRIVETGKVIGGLGIVENAFDRAARIAYVAPEDIAGPGEERLLEQAKALMARLPFDALDVLVIDEMGKDKSGAGMDTNVLGRMMIRDTGEFDRPAIRNVAVLDLTDASRGNATGIGLADFTTFRLLEKTDLYVTYVNSMTAGLGGVQRAQLPIVLPTDRDAIAGAILTCGRADPDKVRLVRVRDTLALADLLVSATLADEVAAHPGLELVGEAGAMSFTPDGTLLPWQ